MNHAQNVKNKLDILSVSIISQYKRLILKYSTKWLKKNDILPGRLDETNFCNRTVLVTPITTTYYANIISQYIFLFFNVHRQIVDITGFFEG